MFDNSISLVYTTGSVSVTDTDNGRTTRRLNAGSGVFQELVIGHQESAENKPLVTDRTLVQRNIIQPDAISGKPVRASVGLTISYPRSGFVHGHLTAACEDLISFLTQSGGVMGTLSAPQITALEANLARLFNGES